jgi:Fic family protein
LEYYSRQNMTRSYIWERSDWPRFGWDAEQLLGPLGKARQEQGLLAGMMTQVGFHEQRLVDLEARTEEATGTSEIESQPVSRVAVRSSIARRLHIESAALDIDDPRAEGLVEMTLDATLRWDASLTVERLHRWHRWLAPFPQGRRRVAVGAFRDDAEGPMQVVSGCIDRPTVDFQAPPAQRIASEIDAFLEWFNRETTEDGLLRSAIAHLWFVTIHPYEDGNGRIARAIADMALARDETSGRRFFSMSRAINDDKASYYEILERTQRGGLDVTEWLVWFLERYVAAIDAARRIVQEVTRADAFWRKHAGVTYTQRQRRVLDRYLHGFEDKLTAKKWAALAKTSHATAARDIASLLEKGVLVQNPGGSKNTSYSVV